MAKQKVNRRGILKKLQDQKSDRGKVTLYLSRQLMGDFKKQCGDFSPSQVIEELMREFIANSK